MHWKAIIGAAPVLVISFGFHNMVPSLVQYFKGDARRLGITIFVGSSIPLFIYLIWEAVMLGIIPLEGREGLLAALDQGEAITSALRNVVGKSWVSSAAQCFALFGIVTSFLAISLSVLDFLADGLKMKKERLHRLLLIVMILLPPLILAMVYPRLFIQALNMAGGLAAIVLFGMLPALMVWVCRYKMK